MPRGRARVGRLALEQVAHVAAGPGYAEHAGLGHLLYTAGLAALPIPPEFTGDAGDEGDTVGFS